MLYLPRPPENSSGPQPRASNTERQRGVEQEGERHAQLFFFFFLCDDSLCLYFSFVLFFSSSFRSQTQAFDHFRPVSCFSCGRAVCEHTTPHAGERLVQKENKTCSDFVAQLRGFSLFFPPDVLTVRQRFFLPIIWRLL